MSSRAPGAVAPHIGAVLVVIRIEPLQQLRRPLVQRVPRRPPQDAACRGGGGRSRDAWASDGRHGQLASRGPSRAHAHACATSPDIISIEGDQAPAGRGREAVVRVRPDCVAGRLARRRLVRRDSQAVVQRGPGRAVEAVVAQQVQLRAAEAVKVRQHRVQGSLGGGGPALHLRLNGVVEVDDVAEVDLRWRRWRRWVGGRRAVARSGERATRLRAAGRRWSASEPEMEGIQYPPALCSPRSRLFRAQSVPRPCPELAAHGGSSVGPACGQGGERKEGERLGS